MIRTVGLMLLIIMTTGMAGDGWGDQKIPLQAIYSSAYCGISKPVIKRINSEAELTQLVDSASSGFQPKPSIGAEFDYTKQSLIIVALGKKHCWISPKTKC
ncbi:MAG: hypothetical protein ACI9KN_000267 [Gammaproteobacteria bacterium]|jgi:hypothetical protein